MANKWAYQKALKFLNDMPSNFPHAVYVAEALYAAAEEGVRAAFRNEISDGAIRSYVAYGEPEHIKENEDKFVQRVLDKLGR